MQRSSQQPLGNISRRHFLGGLLGAGAASTLPPGLAARSLAGLRSDDTVTVSILHTTDLHGRILGNTVRGFGDNVGGMARCATQIRRWRRENPNTLLFDIGDLLQGTDVGWRTGGRIMTDCLNALNYDAWSIGNHEFDWGLEPLHDALIHSHAPVIGTNILLEGRRPEDFDQGGHPLSNIRPWKVFTVGGMRIGVLGFSTPGMPYWFPPSFHEGMSFEDCADPAKRGEAALRAMGIDALVLLGHMGLRPDGDNQSNQVRSVMQACPSAAAYIGAHSHRLHDADKVGDVIYTQANFWGSHLGRLNLVFDRHSRKLIARETEMAFMSPETAPDPIIMDLCRDRLDESERALAQPVGRLASTLSVESEPGRPSQVERLIAAAIMAGMRQRQTRVDGVIHGQFMRQDFRAGTKTVADMWPVIPFENFTMTADLTPGQIRLIMEECYNSSPRNLMGMHAEVSKDSERWTVDRILDRDDAPADPTRRYRIALNTWDAQSGGGRLMRLRQILSEPESNRTVHAVQTRQSLIEYFMEQQIIDSTHLASTHYRRILPGLIA
ncbi:MAG: bifunctional metallophosphatase/5'-nucleotidase [Phycisphaerales bacterium]|nr:MAG: bifunctional metallophosphatase/5'-nucleotidase [Phycisphaerales bacterium]